MHQFKSVLDLHLGARVRAVTDEKDQANEYFDERAYLEDFRNDEELWKCLNPKLYMIFWYLNLQSLLVPEEIYGEAMRKIDK